MEISPFDTKNEQFVTIIVHFINFYEIYEIYEMINVNTIQF